MWQLVGVWWCQASSGQGCWVDSLSYPKELSRLTVLDGPKETAEPACLAPTSWVLEAHSFCSFSFDALLKMMCISHSSPLTSSLFRLSLCCQLCYAQSCPILCDLVDCSHPGSSLRGLFQARILQWVAISSSICYQGPEQKRVRHFFIKSIYSEMQ